MKSSGILVLTEEDLALPSALSLEQSLLLAWWQVVALVAGTIIMFVAAYITFMRQEVRGMSDDRASFDSLVTAWIESQTSPNTQAAYRGDLDLFRAWWDADRRRAH